jgi:hypothetical protein
MTSHSLHSVPMDKDRKPFAACAPVFYHEPHNLRCVCALGSRDDRRSDMGGPGQLEHSGGLAAGGAGGQHVIDDEDPSPLDMRVLSDDERPSDIPEAFSRQQVLLFQGVTNSQQEAVPNGNPEALPQAPGDDVRTVGPALQAARPIHGNRHDQIGPECQQCPAAAQR